MPTVLGDCGWRRCPRGAARALGAGAVRGSCNDTATHANNILQVLVQAQGGRTLTRPVPAAKSLCGALSSMQTLKSCFYSTDEGVDRPDNNDGATQAHLAVTLGDRADVVQMLVRAKWPRPMPPAKRLFGRPLRATAPAPASRQGRRDCAGRSPLHVAAAFGCRAIAHCSNGCRSS
jgi:hypothetical protein